MTFESQNMNINMNMNMTSLVELTWDESEDMVFSCEDGAQQVLMSVCVWTS